MANMKKRKNGHRAGLIAQSHCLVRNHHNDDVLRFVTADEVHAEKAFGWPGAVTRLPR